MTTYFTGVHFGKGKWEGASCYTSISLSRHLLTNIAHCCIGQEVTAWGKYVDTLTLFPDGQQNVLPGSSGQWLISKREVGFMKRLGEEGVMDGE